MTCPKCGSEETEYAVMSGIYGFYSCHNCGAVIKEEKPYEYL